MGIQKLVGVWPPQAERNGAAGRRCYAGVALAVLFLLLLRWFVSSGGPVLQPVAAAGDGDDLGMMQEPVEDGGGGRHIADQLAPVLQRPIGGHHRGFGFVPPHDDLKQVFAGALGQNA